MYEKIFLLIKARFNKLLAYRIIAACLPNRAVFSENPLVVSFATDADLKQKTLAFKKAVIKKNKKIVEMLMIRSNINDYFLLHYDFNIVGYNKAYIKRKAISYENFKVLMIICKNYKSFIDFPPQVLEIAAREKNINWNKLSELNWSYYSDAIIEAAKVKPPPAEKNILFRNINVAKYLLTIHKYDFNKEDMKKFIRSREWALLALEFNLFNRGKIILEFLYSGYINVFKYCEGTVFNKKISEKIINKCRTQKDSGAILKFFKMGCITLTGSEIFQKFYMHHKFIISLKSIINIREEIKNFPGLDEKSKYAKFLSTVDNIRIWDDSVYFITHKNLKRNWKACYEN